MKVLIILSYSWSPFIALTYLYGENELFARHSMPFWSIFSRKKNNPKSPFQHWCSDRDKCPNILEYQCVNIWQSKKSAPNTCTVESCSLIAEPLLIITLWTGMTVSRKLICNETLLHNYSCPLGQYNETWWKWCRMTN